MKGLTTSTDRVSLTFPVPRNQSTYLKKHVKPTRVCFSSSASFPKSRISVPLLESAANNFASSSSFNHIFAHDRRLKKRVSASNNETSPTTGEANRLQNRVFMVFSCLGLLWLVKKENVPYYFRYHMTVGLLLDASEFFHGINFTRRLRMYFIMLAGCSSCSHLLVHFLYPMRYLAGVIVWQFVLLFTVLGLAPGPT